VHGGVDGYSRIPVYIHASNNNRADTVLRLFLGAVDEYGLPLRVRSDKGGENVDVSWYMLTHNQRGPNRGSMITGIELQICTVFSLFSPPLKKAPLSINPPPPLRKNM
jgi:hypothetical protein